MADTQTLSLETARNRILHYKSESSQTLAARTPLQKASILIPLIYEDDKYSLLLTLRSGHLRHDKNTVAFPGGKADDDDKDEIATALREAEEEIGLLPGDVDVICTIVPFINGRGILITPVVAFIPRDFVPRPNEEVNSVFTVPLDRFLSKNDYHFKFYSSKNHTYRLHFFNDTVNNVKYTTWGLTAGICVRIAAMLYQKRPEFIFGYDSELNMENVTEDQEHFIAKFSDIAKSASSKL